MADPFSIYSTWGFHDELGDRVELTEKLALTALDALDRWKRKFGISTDFFHIDCMWFDNKKPYRHFKKPHWPNGFEKVARRAVAQGMKPGLWYATSGGRMKHPSWKKSISKNNWSFSLADGPYAKILESDLFYAAEKWNVRFYKFDFADFFANAKSMNRHEEESYRLNVRSLKDILRRLKKSYPDCKIIAHCGYRRIEPEVATGQITSPENDPSWLEALDYLFSGDPRPGDVPQTFLPRALDLYQDRQVWKMIRDGFPLHRIEDHGVILGNTNTCFYRGRRGFRRTHVAQLARGGRRDMFYGDPTLPTDDDLRFMLRARSVFFDAFNRGLETSFVGPGEPCMAPWHGYLTGGGHAGLLYLVNPHFSAKQVELVLPGLYDARVLFQDGRRDVPVQTQTDRLTVELLPEQTAVIGLGYYADGKFEIGRDEDAPIYSRIEALPVRFDPADKGGFVGQLEKSPGSGKMLVTVQALKSKPAGHFSAEPHRLGNQHTKIDPDRSPLSHKLLKIEVRNGAKTVKPSALVPYGPVWSGIAWVAKIYDSCRPCKITVDQNLEEPKRLKVAAYKLT